MFLSPFPFAERFRKRSLQAVRGQYLTFKEISALKSNATYFPNKLLDVLKTNPALTDDISEYLAGLGVRRISFLNNGANAIVFKITNHQLLRISLDAKENPRPLHPAILQPICTQYVGENEKRIRIELLPEVETKDISKDDVEVVCSALVQSGFAPNMDKHVSNVGKLLDGTPILLDPGYIEKRPSTQEILVEGLHLENWFDGKGKWKQHMFYPALQTHQLVGVFTPRYLEDLSQVTDSSLSSMIEKNGLYPEQFGNAADIATKNYEIFLKKNPNETDKRWEDFLKQECNKPQRSL